MHVEAMMIANIEGNDNGDRLNGYILGREKESYHSSSSSSSSSFIWNGVWRNRRNRPTARGQDLLKQMDTLSNVA